MIQKTINSFTYALRGLKTVWNEEHNFRTEVVAGILVIGSIFYFDFSLLESSLLIFAITLVLVSEIINTVIEDLCNKVEPSHDYIIAKIKDASGAFVLLSSLGSLTIGILVFLNHFS